jgi:hypothetical protein
MESSAAYSTAATACCPCMGCFKPCQLLPKALNRTAGLVCCHQHDKHQSFGCLLTYCALLLLLQPPLPEACTLCQAALATSWCCQHRRAAAAQLH